MYCASCGTSLPENTVYCTSCGADARTGVPSQLVAGGAAAAPVFVPGYPPGPVMDYASWGSRVLGYLIDGLLVGGAMAILYLVLGGALAGIAHLAGSSASAGMCCVMIVLFPVATLLVGLYNRVYLISLRGYSIGQGVMKLKVVDANGGLLTQGNALIRLLVHAGMGFIPFLPLLDLLWPLWDVRRQTLHDKVVNCYVINNPQG